MKNVRELEVVMLEKSKVIDMIDTIGAVDGVSLIIVASLANNAYDVKITSKHPMIIQSSPDYDVCISIVCDGGACTFIKDDDYYQITL